MREPVPVGEAGAAGFLPPAWQAARVTAVAVCIGLVLGWVAGGVARAASEDWNDAGIHWLSYDEGLATARKTHHPICLIFYTTWCPHCAHYSKVFSDPAVARKAKSFVMIRIDKDKHPDLSARYRPDGEYIPRTYFLSSDGKLDPTLTEKRTQYRYFYAESDPAAILAGMDRALKKLH